MPPSTPTRLVCFAMPVEAAPFRRRPGPPGDVEVLVTGIGRRNAERAIREALERRRPAAVLTCGFAGGLDRVLRPGAMVYSGDLTPAAVAVLERSGAVRGRIHCAERIAVTVAEKSALRAATSALAVEMESGWIQACCAAAGVRCGTIRIVSDTANEDLPLDFNQLSRADYSLHFGKLFLAIARSPGCIPALMRLDRQTRFAAVRLAGVLREVLAAEGAPPAG